MAKLTPEQEEQLRIDLESPEGRRKIAMAMHQRIRAMHQRIRDYYWLRSLLPPEQLPADVLHEHGMKTNDEYIRDILDKK